MSISKFWRKPEPAAATWSANDVWKSRWSAWVRRSTVAAAVAHALIFVVWPMWEIRRPPAQEDVLEFIQLKPVAAYGGAEDPGAGLVAALPTEEELELAREDATQTENESQEADETFGVRLLSAGAYEVVPDVVTPTSVVTQPTPSDLILEQLSALTPEVTQLVPNLNWPQIRNPTVITRFLRTRYNTVHEQQGATGYVSVAMWIDERGAVEWAQVSESSGHELLDNIALSLFREIVAFSPARSRGSPIPVRVTISVPFTLPW